MAIPEYDHVNERVSLGRAQRIRDYAVHELKLRNGMLILDAGIGPGTMSETVMKNTADLTIVGLDASADLLQAAQKRLRLACSGCLHLVRGVFEALPFRESSFSRIISAFAFRDARNRDLAIDEFHRAIEGTGFFAIVDLGKPDNRYKRAFVSIYVHYLTPLIARLSMSNAIHGNPWRMIFPTYQALGRNQELVKSLGRRFTDVEITEFALGGMIVVLARKG
jgi:demethylmenaquinone methyltransferase/2-methoxy-6-polyprenyl-1,4-benzoquinol methylase